MNRAVGIEGERPADRIKVAPTTRNNPHRPLYIGHADSPALHADYGARTGGRDIRQLGRVLTVDIDGETHSGVLQSNLGGELVSNIKLIVDNRFPYEMKADDHHPPADWETYIHRVRQYGKHMAGVMRRNPETYMTVTTPSGLAAALSTEGRIGRLVSVEGMPQVIDVSHSEAAGDLATIGTEVVNLMWNYTTDVGGTHADPDTSLTKKGESFLAAVGDVGIAVVDASHANERTTLRMTEVVSPNRRVMISHTGARIGEVAEKSRNATDDAVRAVFQRDGIVGVAITKGMLGGDTVDHVVDAAARFVELDPTGGELVTLGPDSNGIAPASRVREATTVVELHNVADRMLERGFGEDLVNRIFWKNAVNFWHGALTDAQKAA